MPLLGYFVGNRIPGLDKYIELVIVGVVILSLLLAIWHILKDKKTRLLLYARIKSGISRVFLNKRID